MADGLLSALDFCLYLCPYDAHLISQVLGISLNLAGSYFSSSNLLIGKADSVSIWYLIQLLKASSFNTIPGGFTSSSIHPSGINYPHSFLVFQIKVSG